MACLRGALACLLVQVLLGCSTTPGASGDPADVGVSDGGAAPAPDGAAATCPLGTHATAEGSCDAALSWQKRGTLAPARNHHATVAAKSDKGMFLYVLGGLGDMAASPIPFYDDVQMSAVADDGTLGSWRPTTSLPQKRAGHGVALVGSAIVITGGLVQPDGVRYEPSNTTIVSRVGADAALGAWGNGPTLPSARYHHAMATYKQWVYVVGGLGAGGALGDVARATVSSDGSVSPWESMTKLPAPRGYHGSIVHDGALYVVGGANDATNTFYTEVLRAVIGDDGALGPWKKVSDLPENDGALSLVEFADHLYVIGGVAGVAGGSLAVVGSVRRALFAADGSLGAWEEMAKLPTARGHVHQTPLVGARMYSVGGALDDGSAIGDVVAGTFQ